MKAEDVIVGQKITYIRGNGVRGTATITDFDKKNDKDVIGLSNGHWAYVGQQVFIRENNKVYVLAWGATEEMI